MTRRLSTELAGEVDEWMFRAQGATSQELLAWTPRRSSELGYNHLNNTKKIADHHNYRRNTNRWDGECKDGRWKLKRPKDLALTLSHARTRVRNPKAFIQKLVKEGAAFILANRLNPEVTQEDIDLATRQI